MLRSTFTSVGASSSSRSVFSVLQRWKHIEAIDGNEAAAYVAFSMADVGLGYPITPSSSAFEMMEKWANVDGRKNAFGDVPSVSLLQSEAGVSGSLHGALATGVLGTTFTSSQGLMLMVPNLFKMGNGNLPAVIHVASRAMIRSKGTMFCDHSDVMTVRPTGWALLASSCVQEVHDLGLAAHLSAIKGHVPFMHFYDGFRTSHEMAKIECLDYDEIATIIPHDDVHEFRQRGFNANHPQIRGTAVNSDVLMQWDEACNKWFVELPDVVEGVFRDIEGLTGRHYDLFDYSGHPQPDAVIVIMGSGANTACEVVNHMNVMHGKRLGVIKVHLYRPFSAKHFLEALPDSAKRICVLDRVREYGSIGQPLFLDVCGVLHSKRDTREVIGGLYGLDGKSFTPGMIRSILNNLEAETPKDQFTVGIVDDVLHNSLPMLPEDESTVPPSIKQSVFWGVGADGTVGANKEAMSIISHNTPLEAQGYFAFEAKKSGGWTFSHLRFGPEKILAEYEIQHADYVACHNQSFVSKYPILNNVKEGGIFVLNSRCTSLEEQENLLPAALKTIMAKRNVKFYNIDASGLAKSMGMGGRINMIMQTVFFYLSQVVDLDLALTLLKDGIRKNYKKQGEKVIELNIRCVDEALKNLKKIDYPREMWLHADEREDPNAVPTHLDALEANLDVPQVVKDVVIPTLRMKGEQLPVSAFLDIADGRIPTGTSKYEKRGVAFQIPVWDEEACVKCNDCSLSCPHAAIRPFLVTKEEVDAAPEGFKHITGIKNYRFSIQIAPFDCMGCGVCVEACRDEALTMVPVKDLDMKHCSDLWEYAFKLPIRSDEIKRVDAGSLQYRQPLLEFSGACAGCGQTPYAKLLTQLFGERMIIANATGCSLIWTASFPVTAYTTSYRGRGPAWGNSLFEDNAEYGFGMVCATSHRRRVLSERVEKLMDVAEDPELRKKLDAWAVKKNDPHGSMMTGDALIDLFNDRPELLNDPLVKEISQSSDLFTKPSHWLIGGDGWAYDIGYGGLDHVLAQSVDVNVLVFDNEAYANTGFQVSKSTPHGGVTKFALAGKRGHKKELGMMAMQYGHVYVATVSLGGNKNHLVKVLMEAEAYPGPSLIITYCPCIGHGIEGNMCQVNEQERLAVLTGYWPLYKYNPLLKEQGKNPFSLISKKPTMPLEKFLDTQIRFTAMKKENPKLVRSLYEGLKSDVDERWKRLERMAAEE